MSPMPNDLDMQRLWQRQPGEGEASPRPNERERARRLAGRVRRRNTREYLAGGLVVAVFAAQASSAPNRLVVVGCVLAIAGTLYVMRHLSAHGTTRSPADYGVLDCRAFHRAELVRERDLLRGVWRWYLGPLIPGGVVFLVGHALARPDGWSGAFVVAAVCTLFFVLVGHMNARAADRLQQQIDTLDAAQ